MGGLVLGFVLGLFVPGHVCLATLHLLVLLRLLLQLGVPLLAVLQAQYIRTRLSTAQHSTVRNIHVNITA